MSKRQIKRNQNTVVQAKKQYSVACGLHCIRVKDICVTMGETSILQNVNLHIHCGKLTAIIGRNGAGKSTLMKAILDEIPHKGTTEFRNMRTNRAEKLNLGYVPQHVNIDRNTPTSVYDLFASFISNTPVFLRKNRKVYRRIKEQLAIFDAEELIDRCISDLSGGELQRVMLAIATTPVPNLLLLDEPVSGVDHNGMELFYQTIDRLTTRYDLAVLLVSHDLEYVAKYADYVVLLDGTIRKEGTPKEVYESMEFKQVFGNINCPTPIGK